MTRKVFPEGGKKSSGPWTEDRQPTGKGFFVEILVYLAGVVRLEPWRW